VASLIVRNACVAGEREGQGRQAEEGEGRVQEEEGRRESPEGRGAPTAEEAGDSRPAGEDSGPQRRRQGAARRRAAVRGGGRWNGGMRLPCLVCTSGHLHTMIEQGRCRFVFILVMLVERVMLNVTCAVGAD
jgi:hypothetical protein